MKDQRMLLAAAGYEVAIASRRLEHDGLVRKSPIPGAGLAGAYTGDEELLSSPWPGEPGASVF